MNSFETPSYRFFTFDKENLEQISFVIGMQNDPLMIKYLNDITIFLDSHFNDGLLDSSYLVSENYGDLIGFVSIYSRKKLAYLDYGIERNHRGYRNKLGETRGCTLLRETIDFIFERSQIINEVELFIEKSNIRSIKAAERAGFINDDGMLHHKYRGI